MRVLVSLLLLAAVVAWLAWYFNRDSELSVRIDVIDEEGNVNMGKPLSNTFTRSLTLVPKNPSGLRDKVQAGSVTAESSDPSVATVALDPNDEFRAVITPGDDVSSAEVTFTFKADADLGEGVVEIQGSYSCAIVDEAAAIIEPVEGEDTPK